MVRASAPFSFVEWSNRDSLAPLLRPLRAVGAAIGPMLDKQVSRQGVCYLLTFGATLLIAFMNPKVRDAVRCSLAPLGLFAAWDIRWIDVRLRITSAQSFIVVMDVFTSMSLNLVRLQFHDQFHDISSTSQLL